MKRVKMWWLGFVTRMFERVSNIYPAYWQDVVKRLYKQVRVKENFILKTKDILVKKGKIHYTLVVIETAEGLVKFNLGRH